MAKTFGHCNTEQLKEAFGRALNKNEMVKLSNTIEENARFLQRVDETLSREDALSQSVPQALLDMQNTIAKDKRDAAHNLAIIVSGIKNQQKVWSDMPAEGLRSLMVGSPFQRAGAKESVGAFQDAKANRNVGMFNAEMSRKDVDGTLLRKYNSSEMDDDLQRAAFALDDVDGAGDTLGNLDPDAVKQATIMLKHSEMARQNYVRSGGSLKRLPGRLVRQTHRPTKLRKAKLKLHKQGIASSAETDKDAWVNYMEERLDLDRIDQVAERDGDTIKTVLGNAFDDLSRGEHLRLEVSDSDTGNIGFGLEQEKIFTFKAGVEGEIEYRKMFGADSVREAYHSEMMMLGHKEGLIERLGPNASGNLQAIALASQKMARKAGKRAEKQFNKFTKDGQFLDTKGQGLDKMSLLWKEVSGQNSNPVENMWTTVGATLRLSQNAAHLGRATLASVVDIATLASQMRYEGKGLFDAYGEAFSALFSTKNSPFMKEIWEPLDVGVTTMNGYNSRFSISDAPVGAISKANSFIFRFNLLSPWTDNMKRGALIAHARNMGLQSAKKWDDLHPQFRGNLAANGMDGDDWATLAQIEYKESPDGKAYMSMDALQTIPDEAYAKKVNSSGKSLTEVKRELDEKLRRYYTDQNDIAVVTPDAETRARTSSGFARGTMEREISSSFFQFSSFPLTMYSRVIRREMFGRGTPEISMAKVLKNSFQGNGNGEAQGMAELIVSSTVMGYVALSLKDLSAGKTPRIPDSPTGVFELMIESMLQGGAAGIYGDILLGDAMQKDPLKRGVLETLGGPVISFLAKDVIGGGQALAYGMLTGDDGGKIASRIWGSTRRNLPLANTFWLKATLDYLVLNKIQEHVSPGSMDVYRERLKERGQTSLIPLGG